MGFPEERDTPGAAGVVKMSDEAVRTVRRRFRATAQVVYGASEDLPDALSDLASAAGQFSGEISAGTVPFTASWQSTFELVAGEAETISSNVNNLALDLGALDVGAS